MAEVLTHTKVACDHCGDPCLSDAIKEEQKNFCCHGCQTVYHLLSDSGLENYYKIEEKTPGISMKRSISKKRYEHLDDETVLFRILDFYDGKTAKITFKTPQIHCSSCVYLLENIHKIEPAVIRSEVFFGKQEVAITYNPNKIKLSELAALLGKIGYDPDLSLGKLDKDEKDHSDRPLFIKIGIAGFAFGNIMLFSLPEYLAGPGGVDAQFIHLFGMLNIALALPVFLYSASDFYRTAWTGIRQKVWNMDIAISLGIMAMFFRSLYEILSGYGVGYMDSFAMLVFFLLVGRLFQNKTYERLSFDRDYKSYFPLSVLKLEGDQEKSIPATNITIDDIILIRNGELIPADSILLESEAHIDYSFVTGESDPVKANEGGLIYAGGRLFGASARFQVKKPVSKSYLTRLWNNEAFRKDSQESLRSISQRFSRYFSPAVISIATIAALYWLPTSPANAINAFSAVLIIACPCALALSAPFTLGWATNILGKNKFYMKNSDITERIAGINSIVFDKTGTLTWSERADISFRGDNLNEKEIEIIRSAVHNSTHPLSRKVYNFLTKDEEAVHYAVSNFQENPGKGVTCVVDGHRIVYGSAEWIGLPKTDQQDAPASASQVYVSVDGVPKGYFEVTSAYREGLSSLFESIKGNINSYLLSGDNDKEKQRLLPLFNHPDNMRFQQSPADKLHFISKLKQEGHHVMMLGDGLNDAGALKNATVGVSISEDTGSFTPASDVIMEASTLPKLSTIIRFSQKSMTIIKISFVISVLYNIIGLAYAVTATLSPLICAIIMPVSSISVILFTTLSTNIAAKRLGLEAWK